MIRRIVELVCVAMGIAVLVVTVLPTPLSGSRMTDADMHQGCVVSGLFFVIAIYMRLIQGGTP